MGIERNEEKRDKTRKRETFFFKEGSDRKTGKTNRGREKNNLTKEIHITIKETDKRLTL